MSWQTVKLGDFLKVRQDRFKPKDKAIEGLKRVIKIDFSGNIYLSNKDSNTDMVLVKHGDLLISGINVEKGAVAVYDGQEDVTATIHYSSYEFDDEKIDVDFLKLFLKSPEFLNAIKEQVPGGIKTEIKPKHLLPLEIIIPELHEQKEVVEKFSSFHSKQNQTSTELNHQLALVKELRQAYLREAMQGKLVPQNSTDEAAEILLEKIQAEKEKLTAEKKIKRSKPLPPINLEEIPFEIPSNWTWCRLGELIDLISGQHIDTNDYNEKGEGFPYLTGPADFGEIYPIPTKWTTKPKVFANENDILITVKGSGVGKTNLSNLDKVVISRQLMAIRTNFISRIHLHFFLDSSFDLLQSEKKGTGIPGITRENILDKAFPLPPLAEQERIVAKLEKLMKFCDELEANIRQGIANANTLLQVALKEALEPK